MLDIYGECLNVARDAYLAACEIARHDPDLARQLRRAGTSVPLNVSEGSGSRGGNRNARYHTALGSAEESRTIFEIAEAAGWIGRDAARSARLRRIVGTLIRVLRLDRR